MGNKDNYLSEVYNLLLSGRDSSSIAKRIEITQKEIGNLPSFVNDTTSFIATIQKHIAINYSILNDFRNAISYCDKTMASLKNAGKESSEAFAEVLSLKCKYQFQQTCDQSYEAISSGEAAKKLFEILNIKTVKYAELLEDLAKAYSQNFNYEKSIQLEKDAIVIFEVAKDWLAMANAYNNIGNYYQESEDLDNAEYYVKKAVEIIDNHDDAKEYLTAEDEQIGNSVIDYTSRLNKVNELIFYGKIGTRETLARLFKKNKKLAEAINTEKDVGVICKNMGNDYWYASHLLTLSDFYTEDKQFDNAINCAEQSLQILKRIDADDIVNPILTLSMIHYKSGNYEKAIQYAIDSTELLGDNQYEKTSGLSFLAALYYKTKNLTKSEEHLSELLDILKDKICNEIAGMTNEQRQRLWDKYEHNFLLYRNVIKELDHNDAFLSKLYDYLLFSKSFMLDTGINKDDDYLSRLKITWEDIQRALYEDDIAIEFVATTQEDHEGFTYNAIVIDKHCQNPQMIELYNDFDTKEDINTLGEKIWGPILNKYNNVRNIFFSADFFFHAFPIEYSIVGDYGLMFEKFNMYRLSTTKELLKKKNENKLDQAVLYGGLEYNQMSDFALEEITGTLPSLLRGISERGGFEPLYNTLDEVNDIKELLSNQNIAATLFVGNEGTEESFRKLSNMDVHILHLATHGMYIEPENVSYERQTKNFDFLESLNNENNPVKEDVTLTHSFLVLSGGNKLIQHDKVLNDDDGILTAKEISQTNLKGVDLVVLSACESALGDINSNGVCGLQRGFKKAGVNTILMSVNKVDDEATKILMVEFYRNLISGKSKLQSLKDAQKYLREYENGKFVDYKYWGSFIMLDGLD
jgi:CHAT domain-containing protein